MMDSDHGDAASMTDMSAMTDMMGGGMGMMMGGGMMWTWMILEPLLLIAAVVLLVVIAVKISKGQSHVGSAAAADGASAQRILSERYARGEIDTDEYQQRRDTL